MKVMGMPKNFVAAAADILFDQSILDNAIRGVYIEALVYSQVRTDEQWRYVGMGWGPWDLQRGTHCGGDRVRIQVKVTAYDQLWPRPRAPRYEFDLGWKKKPLGYFESYYNQAIFGECEPQGYRCELFLFAWHGPDPAKLTRCEDLLAKHGGDQRDPNEYKYVVHFAKEFADGSQTRLKLSVPAAFNGARHLTFGDLPRALNEEAGRVLQNRANA